MKVQNFLLYIYYFESESHSVVSDSLKPHGLYSSWNSPDQITGVGSLSLLQGIFPTQGLSPGLPHCRRILYLLSQKGSPRILELLAYPFSRGSSWPRNGNGVSCIAGDSLATELSGKPGSRSSPGEGNGNAFQYSWGFPDSFSETITLVNLLLHYYFSETNWQ